MSKIIDQIGTLAYGEKVELLEALKTAIAEELADDCEREPQVCPWCGSPHYVKKGRGQDGSQRWLCKGCARTFSQNSANLLSRSKLTSKTWMIFAECMTDGLALRETGLRCGVSLPTAWFMRMRVCELVSYRRTTLRRGNFHTDETYLVDNLSGNHKKSRYFTLPRKPHRNGRDGRKGTRSKSKGRVAIVCGINEFGDCFCDLVDKGAPTKADIRLVLERYIPAGSFLITDGHLSYPDDMWGIPRETVDPKNPLTGDINMVNALHSRLKEFLAPFHGVSSRRLQRYLDWFCYREQFKNSDADKRQLLFRHEAQGRYRYTRQLTFLELRFPIYWQRRYSRSMTSHMSMLV